VASELDEGFRLGVETRQPFYLATANVARAIYLAFRGDIVGAETSIRDVERVVLGAQADGVLSETRGARGIIDLAAGRNDERTRGSCAVRPGPSVVPRHVRRVALSPTSPLPRSRRATRASCGRSLQGSKPIAFE
jgi:hypothetical protein